MSETWTATTIGGLAAWVRASDGATRSVLLATSYPSETRAVTNDAAQQMNRLYRVARPGGEQARWVPFNTGPTLDWLDPAEPISGPGSTVEISTP